MSQAATIVMFVLMLRRVPLLRAAVPAAGAVRDRGRHDLRSDVDAARATRPAGVGHRLLTVIVLTGAIVAPWCSCRSRSRTWSRARRRSAPRSRKSSTGSTARSRRCASCRSRCPAPASRSWCFGAAPTDMLGSVVAVVGPAVVQFLSVLRARCSSSCWPQGVPQLCGELVLHPRGAAARAEDPQRHRGQSQRLSDRGDRHQSRRSASSSPSWHVADRPADPAAVGRAGLRAQLHSLCRPGDHVRAAVRRSA